MNTVVLVRHAETAMAGRFCGHSDPDLNPAGEAQLARIAQQAASLGIQRMLSSDLRRASRTAQAIARQIGIEVELRPTLREIHFGLWEGLHWDEIAVRFPNEAQAWVEEFPMRCAPGGERYLDFSRRIDNEFTSLLCSRAQQITAVVTHRGVMHYALTRFFGRSDHGAFQQTAPYGAIVPAIWFVSDENNVMMSTPD